MRLIWFLRDFYFKEIVYGYFIWMVCFIPIIVLLLVVELGIDIKALTFPTPSGSLTGTTGSVVSYLSIYVVHVIVCISLFISYIMSDIDEVTALKQRIVKKHVVVIIVITSVIFIFSAYSKMNISMLSHGIVYKYFKHIEEMSNLFETINIFWGRITFYKFSIVPVSAVILGLSAVGISCFEMSINLCKFLKVEDHKDIKKELSDVLNSSRQCFIKLLLVLTTSSVATSMYFLLPYEGIDISPYSYYSYAKAMSLKWGSLYSSTILFVFLVPYIKYTLKIKSIRRSVMLLPSSDIEFFDNTTSGFALLSENSGYVLSVMLPLVISIVSPLIT